MTNSELFKQAHAMTRQTVHTGDSYAVTFGACLKLVRKQASMVEYHVTVESGALVVGYTVSADSQYDAKVAGYALFKADHSKQAADNAEVTICRQVSQHKQGYALASMLGTGDTIMVGDHAHVIAEKNMDRGRVCLTLGENGMVRDYGIDTLVYRFNDYWQAMDTLPAM